MMKPKFITIDGAKIAYYEKGRGETILLIHGLGGAAINWEKNIPQLSNKYHVVAIDLPSFGDSEIPNIENLSIKKPDYSYFSEFVKKFVDKIGISQMTLVGHSMGGGISIDFALKYSEMVKRLILVSSAGLGRQLLFVTMMKNSKLTEARIGISSNKKIISRALRLMVYSPGSLDENQIDAYIFWKKKPEVRELLSQLSPHFFGIKGQKVIYCDSIVDLPMPVMIVWGKQDHVLPARHGWKANQVIPQCELHVIDKCGHIPMIERPEEFNTLVLGFLQKEMSENPLCKV